MTEVNGTNQKGRVALWLIICFCGLLGVGGGYWYLFGQDGAVQDYIPARDRSAVEAIFEQNYYWLINLPYKEALIDFGHDLDGVESADKTTKVSTYKWLVYREKDIVKGFCTYFFMPNNVGRILFLAIDEKYRGQGCGKRLIDGAADRLLRGGCQLVKILVRSENYRAQNLYRKCGFIPTENDGEFMWMERQRG